MVQIEDCKSCLSLMAAFDNPKLHWCSCFRKYLSEVTECDTAINNLIAEGQKQQAKLSFYND